MSSAAYISVSDYKSRRLKPGFYMIIPFQLVNFSLQKRTASYLKLEKVSTRVAIFESSLYSITIFFDVEYWCYGGTVDSKSSGVTKVGLSLHTHMLAEPTSVN